VNLIQDAKRRGALNNVTVMSCHFSFLPCAEGDLAAAEALLTSVLDLAIGAPHVPFEMVIRARLALICAYAGRVPESQQHLQRCHELQRGEDWQGLAGQILLAEAATAACSGHLAEAEDRFRESIETFQRHGLVWNEAEALRLWGQAYAASRRQKQRAFEKFDSAIEIYTRFGAHRSWAGRVEAEKQALAGAGVQPDAYRDGLSEREVEVLRLIAQGKHNLLQTLTPSPHHLSSSFPPRAKSPDDLLAADRAMKQKDSANSSVS
jgi:ATP/maltotriose-dependent transcriptional regulator MalT